MIKRMVRVSLWGLSAKKSAIMERIYELGVFHITPKDDVSTPLLESLRAQRSKVLGLIEALKWDAWRTLDETFVENVRYNIPKDLKGMSEEIGRTIDRLSLRLARVNEKAQSIQVDFAELRKASLVLSDSRTFIERERSSPRAEVTIWQLSRHGQHVTVSRINGDIDSLPSGHEKPWFRHHVFELKDGSSFLITSASQEIQPRLRAEVLENGGAQWKPPKGFDKMGYTLAASEIKKTLRGIPSQMRDSKDELGKLSLQWGANLAAVYMLLSEQLELLLMETAVNEKPEFFSLEAWIPENKVEQVQSILSEDFGNSVMMKWREPDPKKDGVVPTALENRPFFQPFEVFLKLLRLPSYKAYDPSPMIGIFFPFFSGCMVGDIGYGTLTLWLGWHLKQKKAKIINDIGVILQFVAFWSIVWGLVYGEIFGDLGHRVLHMSPLWLDRAHVVPPVMAFSVALGGAHVLLGLFIGMFSGLRNKNSHLWMERLGCILFILALTSALIILRSRLPAGFFTAPIFFLVLGLIFMIKGNGVGGIIESLGTVGNIISYVRIAAIGLSSAILAMVAGKFIDTFGVSVLGLFMAFAIHLLNFVLALGGSSLHSARLHYVEFMGKFYEPGVIEYRPFAKRGHKILKEEVLS